MIATSLEERYTAHGRRMNTGVVRTRASDAPDDSRTQHCEVSGRDSNRKHPAATSDFHCQRNVGHGAVNLAHFFEIRKDDIHDDVVVRGVRRNRRAQNFIMFAHPTANGEKRREIRCTTDHMYTAGRIETNLDQTIPWCTEWERHDAFEMLEKRRRDVARDGPRTRNHRRFWCKTRVRRRSRDWLARATKRIKFRRCSPDFSAECVHT